MRVALIVTLIVLPFALAGACAKSETAVTPEGTQAASSVSSTTAGGPTQGGSSSGSGGSSPTCQGPFCADSSNCGREGHGCLGGACVAGLCQPVQIASNFAANQMVIDATTVYGGIDAASLSQCASGARIARVPRAGGQPVTLVPCGTLAGQGDDTTSLMLGAGAMFWTTQSDPNDVMVGELYRQGVSGPATPTALGVWNVAPETAADATSLYYGAHGLWRVNFDGTNATLLDAHSPLFIAVDDATAYYAYEPCFYSDEDEGCVTEGSIFSIPKAGGTATTLADDLESVMNLSVRGSYLYWIQGQAYQSTIRRLPIAGGQPETLVTDDAILWFAVDDANLYWERNAETAFAQAYEVMTAPLASPTSATVVLHQDNDRMLSMTSDDTVVVWSSAWGKLWLLAK